MSKYTTGDIAKLCGVSVRTVQYYDSRNILVPTELSEGGRRLYSEDALKRMRIICFLREAGVSINRIGDLFEEKHPEKIISVLLSEQENEIREEKAELEKKLEIIESIKNEIKETKKFSVETIGDIAHVMKQKSKLRKLYLKLILSAVPLGIVEVIAIVLLITHNLWWFFLGYLALAIPFAVLLSHYYYKRVAYICPECHEMFKPTFKEMFFAYHTPKMRRLTCSDCGHKGLCIEVYDEKGENK